MSKLTLSVDTRVVSQAKRFAKQTGVSVSEMVEVYLMSVTQSRPPGTLDTPVLHSVRGSLASADTGDYKEHLAAKYR